MFDKSPETFPVKTHGIYLSHCGVSPMYRGAAEEIRWFSEGRMNLGAGLFRECGDVLGRFRQSLASLLQTEARNVSFVKNTAEAMSMIANGYPFEAGDEVISYAHEYPSNHYPWKLQKRRGVTLKLLQNVDPLGGLSADRPCAWSMAELENLVSDRTRLVAVSHVQFTSGFAANLEALGRFCAEQRIDLVVDVAQSLGCLPVYPHTHHVSALAGSGWKWLLGPMGSGVMFTAPEFREKIAVTIAGADVVTQGEDYLDHTWQPHQDGRRFEYSTTQISYAAALQRSLTDLFLEYGPEGVRREVFRLQDVFLEALDRDRCRPLVFPDEHRSGILSLVPADDPMQVARRLAEQDVVASSRGGYLRIAPHFYNDESDLLRCAELLNLSSRLSR